MSDDVTITDILCHHPSLPKPAFDEAVARGLDASEVRRRWPRVFGTCHDCGTTVILYASLAHYVAGNW
jgi:hypothetical protein